MSLKSILIKKGKFTVYNFEVEGTHNYFVGKTGILVHNTCPHNPSKISYTLTAKRKRHLYQRHKKSSTYKKSKFNTDDKDLIIQKIDETIQSPTKVEPTKPGADTKGTIYVKTFEETVGLCNGKSVNSIRVIINEKGEVISAYPIK